ncbi:MAG: CoA transferase [Acetobacteraceae bacterium]|nr:CoA transferase [Acetobacteraceae bacterium]
MASEARSAALGERLFDGLTVIDCASYIAGPAAAAMSDFGAEVIKIEPPGAGDPYRNRTTTPKGCVHPVSPTWVLDARATRRASLLTPEPKRAPPSSTGWSWGADIFITNVASGSRDSQSAPRAGRGRAQRAGAPRSRLLRERHRAAARSRDRPPQWRSLTVAFGGTRGCMKGKPHDDRLPLLQGRGRGAHSYRHAQPTRSDERATQRGPSRARDGVGRVRRT